ncbi:SGNH/GDSL hydrolase family protein [Leuconostoc carnosum]|uniref:SGNH/GDSL hydrolase family protein n=1 Tax=Leuconostoc carnosum TaxID=1252 RepID=UPI0035DC9857
MVSSNLNDWTNKCVVVFGDSIIAGQEKIREQTPFRDIVYAKLAAYKLNTKKFDNFSETGTGQFKGQHNLDKATGWIHDFKGVISHYQQDISLANIGIIAYGNNDWKQLSSNGMSHSIKDVKIELIKNIQSSTPINPKIQLIGVLETVAFREGRSAWYLNGPNGFSYEDMVSTYMSVYQQLNVQIFDLRDYYLGNGCDEYVDGRDHFTKKMHEKIAWAMSDFVLNGYNPSLCKRGEKNYIVSTDLYSDNFTSEINLLKGGAISRIQKSGKQVIVLIDSPNKQLVADALPDNVEVINLSDFYLKYYSQYLGYKGKNVSISDFLRIEDVDGQKIYKLYTMNAQWVEFTHRYWLINYWISHIVSTNDTIMSITSDTDIILSKYIF